MSQTYPLLSMTEDPTHPLAFSSLKNGSSSVDILASGDLFAVFEENPVCLLNAMEAMSGRSRTDTMFEHPYSLSVFYRKSRNPHGPSSRPIFIATFEFSPMTCGTTGGGLLGNLFGNPRRPAEAFMIGNTPRGRINKGMFSMDMGKDRARAALAKFADEYLNVSSPFRFVASTPAHWDTRYTD